MRAEQSIGTQLKKMAPVFETKFADHPLEQVQILQANTRRSLAVYSQIQGCFVIHRAKSALCDAMPRDKSICATLSATQLL
jgi:hypothetical protein